MDKETLSNYGWIVICVLVLAVMLALASPFGTFVSDAVKNTTAGLFGVNQEALGAAGIVIDDQAFCDHTNTTEISASNGTESEPGHDAYTVCADCGKVMTADGEIPFKYIDFEASLQNRELIGYTTEITDFVIPETFFLDKDTSVGGTVYEAGWYKVTSIIQTFKGSTTLTSVTIPDSVTTIGRNAFYECTALTSIKIPNSVTSIGQTAFYRCTSLTSIEIPDSVTSIGGQAFANCSKLTTVTFGENSQLTSIGYNAFSHCDNLTSIIIPNNVTSIGDSAFYQCKKLNSVTLGNSITTIDRQTFRECESLTSIIIPDSVTSIGEDAFRGCSKLTSVTIGSSVTSISAAFINCHKVSSITFKNPNGWWYADTADAMEGTSVDVSDPTTAATYLIWSYNTKYWNRTVS